MLPLLRTNPGLLVWLAIFAIAALVCALLGLAMLRAGASLRPIYWFAGFLMLIGVPQFLAHLYLALTALKEQSPRVAAMAQLTAPTDAESRRAAVRLLFGSDADAALVSDVRDLFNGVATAPELAQFAAAVGRGESVLLASFPGYSAAEKGWVHYLQQSGLSQLKGTGDSQRGFAVTRPGGDRAYALHMNNMVGVWTGPDDLAIRERMMRTGFKIPGRAPLAKGPTDNTMNFGRVGLIAVGIAIYLLLAVLYFFKGSAWASSARPVAGTSPISQAELTARLEAINALDVPFRIERGAGSNELIATWRYADAKWVDLARARGLRRTFRTRLTLDAAAQVVRATDDIAEYDWSVGRGGADLVWRGASGIVFFQTEHQRVFGLQLDERGHFKPELSYAYTFHSEELKAPLRQAITQAGWSWRPVAWQGPQCLRWLTE